MKTNYKVGLSIFCLATVTATLASASPNNIYRWNAAQNSTFVPGPAGCATSIGVGPNSRGATLGTVWTTGCSPGPDGVNYTVYELQNGALVEMEKDIATRIAVSPNNIAWVINAAGQVLYWNGSTFSAAGPGYFCATSVAVGSIAGVDDPWITDCSGGSGANHNVYELKNFTGRGQGGTWTLIASGERGQPSQVTQIAMSESHGNELPWALYDNPNGSMDNILYWVVGSFFNEPTGCGTSIAGGPAGNALVTGCNTYPDHNYDVYTGGGQLMEADAAVQVALSPDTDWPWAIKYVAP